MTTWNPEPENYYYYRGPGSPAGNAGFAAGASRSSVRGANPACTAGQCRLTQAMQILAEAREMNSGLSDLTSRYGRNSMSRALWCDAGGHAFSEKDPGRQRIAITTVTQAGEEEKTHPVDYCGPCATAAGLTRAPRTNEPARILPAVAERQDT